MRRGLSFERGREGVIKKQFTNSSLQVPDSLRSSRRRLVRLLARLIISGLALLTVSTLAHSQNGNGWTFFDAAPPVPPEIYTSSPLQGVWDVETRDNPYIEALTILIHPPNSSLPFQHKGNPLAAHAIWHLKGEAGFRRDAFMVTLESGDGGGVAVEFGQFEYCNCVSVRWEVSPTSDGNTMVGKWTYSDQEGVTVWRRRPQQASVKKMTISSARWDPSVELWRPATFDMEDGPARIDWVHGAGCAGAPGNCLTTRVELYGPHFAGEHSLWMDPEKFGPLFAKWICVDGRREIRWAGCGNETSTDNVIGVEIAFMIQHGLEPGGVNLWVNGNPLPIDIKIDNYPDEDRPKIPKLTSLFATNLAGDTTRTLAEGEPFRLVARFEHAHPDAWTTIDELNFMGGAFADPEQGRSVVLHRTVNARIFRSGWIAITDQKVASGDTD